MARTDYVALLARMQPAVERFERIVRPRAFGLANDWGEDADRADLSCPRDYYLAHSAGPYSAGHRDPPACSRPDATAL